MTGQKNSDKTVQHIAMKAVIVSGKKVLILRKSDAAESGAQKGRYNLPGGRIKPDEAWETAVKREVLEETGLSIKINYPINVGRWTRRIDGVDHDNIALYMVCVPDKDTVILNREHDEYRWIDPKDRRQFDIMDPEEEVIDLFAEWQAR